MVAAGAIVKFATALTSVLITSRRVEAAASTSATATDTAASSANSALRRPIITGCLDECGVRDQACSTECQVCVEKERCKSLVVGCTVCLDGARASRKAASQEINMVADSGGKSLLREGIRMKLLSAMRQALHAHRYVRRARVGVLEAQRQAEWTAHERVDEGKRLTEAAAVLEEARGDVAQWRLDTAKKLKDLRKESAEHRVTKQMAEQDLEEAKERVRETGNELRTAKRNDSKAARHKAVAKNNDAKEDTGQLRHKVKAHERAAQRVDEFAEQKEEDANWFDRGLLKAVARARDSTEEAIANVRLARAAVRASKERLEEAKEKYLQAAAKSRRLDRKVEALKLKLRRRTTTTRPQAPVEESLGARCRPIASFVGMPFSVGAAVAFVAMTFAAF